MRRDLTTLPLCCVLWDDAHGRAAGEYTIEEVKRDLHLPAPIRTFGLLLHEDEQGVTVAQEVTSPDDGLTEKTYRGLGFIPRGMLRELILLGVPKRPTKKRAKEKAKV